MLLRKSMKLTEIIRTMLTDMTQNSRSFLADQAFLFLFFNLSILLLYLNFCQLLSRAVTNLFFHRLLNTQLFFRLQGIIFYKYQFYSRRFWLFIISYSDIIIPLINFRIFVTFRTHIFKSRMSIHSFADGAQFRSRVLLLYLILCLFHYGILYRQRRKTKIIIYYQVILRIIVLLFILGGWYFFLFFLVGELFR